MTNLLQIQMILTPFLFGDASMEELLNAAEDLLKTPIRFAPNGDLRRAIVSRSYPTADTERVYDFYAGEKNIDEARRKRQICLEYFAEERPQLIIDQATGCRKILARVALNGNHLGHVAVPEVNLDLRTLNLEAVEEICRYIGLFVMIRAFHPEEAGKDDLLLGLLDGTATSMIDWRIHERVIRKQDARFRLYFFSGPPPGGNFFTMMEESIRELFPDDNVTVWENGVALLTWRNERLLGEADRMTAGKVLRENVCRCAISPAFEEIFECRTWADRLRRLLAFPELRSSKLVEYDLCRGLVLLHEASREGRSLSQYVSEYVREMSLHDERRGTHYLDTLRAYFASDRNYEWTADALGVHVNTVQYRIRRMQELFGLKLESSEVQFQLMLSLRIFDMALDG